MNTPANLNTESAVRLECFEMFLKCLQIEHEHILFSCLNKWAFTILIHDDDDVIPLYCIYDISVV